MTANQPTPPASLPKYVHEPLAKQDVETLRDARAYVDDLIDWKARPIDADELPETTGPVAAEDATDGWIVEERVRCGDESCKCTSGNEADMHGPYEYRYYREDGTLKKEYVGKV